MGANLLTYEGHESQLWNQDEVGVLDFPWFREYGSVVRLKTCFGVNAVYNRVLLLTDNTTG